MTRNEQNQLIGDWIFCSNRAQRVEQRGRPTSISHVWIIICGLFHNMGGNVCCLLRNVYVAPQSSGEMLIWCETDLINRFALVKAAGIISPRRPYQTQDAEDGHFCTPNDTQHTLNHHLCMSFWLRATFLLLKNVWESEIAQHDIISEMCASMVIFGWKLNCKRQTWISLCLSLSSWQEQSQNFGWSSSWPRCSVQISATRWRWRPLHYTGWPQ